jgi:Tfp pilus assembly protein PilF
MMGKTDDALAAFQHATKCEPPSRNALLGITFIRLRTGQLDRASEALAQYEQLGHAPDAISLALRSVVERRRGNLQTAADLEHQARTLDEGAAQWALDQVNRTSVR